MNAQDREVSQRVTRLARTLRSAQCLRGLAVWSASTLALALALCMADNLLRLPAGPRLALGVIALGWALRGAWRQFLRDGLRRMSPDARARMLETHCGIERNTLINACQFERLETGGVPALFARVAMREGAARTARIPRFLVWNKAELARAGALCGLLATSWLAYVAVSPSAAGNALARFTRPLADVPPLGRVRITVSPDRDTAVYAGDDVIVRARIRARDGGAAPGDTAPILRRTARNGTAGRIDLDMPPEGRERGIYAHTFERVRESFAFSVHGGGTRSPVVGIDVRSRPALRSARFELLPPAYTGLPAVTLPGPPAGLVCLPGSRAELSLVFDRPVDAASIRFPGAEAQAMTPSGPAWTASADIHAGGDYRIAARDIGIERELDVAAASVFLEVDAPPTVAFDTNERNRFVYPGETLAIAITASDDYGMRDVRVMARRAARGADAFEIAHWSFRGPPGRREPVRERLVLTLDAARFEPGETFVLEAVARDYNPAGTPGRSRPLVVRVRRPEDVAGRFDGGLDDALTALRRCIEQQRLALGLTRNLQLHLDDALEAGRLARHVSAALAPQTRAREHGREARQAFLGQNRPAVAARLETLVEHEMGWALEDIGRWLPDPRATLDASLVRVAERQAYILDALIELLGRTAASERDLAASGERPPEPRPEPATEDMARDLRDFLETFVRRQEQILAQTRTLAETQPEDLTDEERDILGQLAREEAEWAESFRDKLNDLSKLPLQDFGDDSIAEGFNAVFQEIQKAAESLYEQKIELAVPQEQAGLENATALMHNLERWLPDTPDFEKWMMEEPPEIPDAALAELPSELEDIVGELLDRQADMTEEVEDISSSWIDSLDKGAGWDALDGPISDMSAKGVTGNRLPNEMEIAGRSGEGRTGRSHGQMVEASAEGKEGRETPARLTPGPFEAGSIEDSSREDPGGATGGGKLSGFSGAGLRGTAPPQRLDQLARLAGRQTEIRQGAERLSLQLRRHRLPSGDLERGIEAMERFEHLARTGRGGEIRQAFDAAVDGLRDARSAVASARGLHRERAAMPREQALQLWQGLSEPIPHGYADMVAAYFRRLADPQMETDE